MITERIIEEAQKFRRWYGKKIFSFSPLAVPLSDGQTGYVVFSTDLQMVNLYLGEEALQGYLRVAERKMSGEKSSLGVLQQEEWSDTDYLELVFARRPALTAQELAVCEASPSLPGRRKGRGSNPGVLYPVVRLCRMFMMDTEVQDPHLLSLMEEALRAMNFFLQEDGEDAGADLAGLWTIGEMLEVERHGESYQIFRTDLPEVQKRVWPVTAISRELGGRVKALRALPREGSWEMLLWIDTPVNERTGDGDVLGTCADGRGKCVALFAASARAQIDPDKLNVRDFAQDPEHLLSLLTEVFAEKGYVPQQIRVADDRTFAVLQSWCRLCGVKLYRMTELPLLADFAGIPSEKGAESGREGRDNRGLLISVSLGTGCWRHLQVRGDMVLQDFGEEIQRAFGFPRISRQGYFTMGWREWAPVNAPQQSAAETTVFGVHLWEGRRFTYKIRKSGQTLLFKGKVLRNIEDAGDGPLVVKGAGTAPGAKPYSKA